MRTCALALFSAYAVAAQQPLRFEVASVRPSPPVPVQGVNVGLHMDGQMARITYLPLSYYISIAYNVKISQIAGPKYLNDRFDLNAALPAGVKQDKLPELLQGLLADRFQLRFHRESREQAVYVITRGKGPLQLKDSAEVPPEANAPLAAGGSGSADGISLQLGGGSSFTFTNGKWEGKRLTLEQVAEQMEQFVGRPLVDQTNLKGSYDFTLEVTPEDYGMMRARAAVDAGFPVPPRLLQGLDTAQFSSLFDAFEKAGLKLESKKLSQPVVVIDSILQKPTEN
jgi:uncharacterized protein (TIGR03435 family)